MEVTLYFAVTFKYSMQCANLVVSTKSLLSSHIADPLTVANNLVPLFERLIS